MASVTLSSKFQLATPKAVREELNLQAGQRFAVITEGDIISLVPIPELSARRGIAKGADTSDSRDRTVEKSAQTTERPHRDHPLTTNH